MDTALQLQAFMTGLPTDVKHHVALVDEYLNVEITSATGICGKVVSDLRLLPPYNETLALRMI